MPRALKPAVCRSALEQVQRELGAENTRLQDELEQARTTLTAETGRLQTELDLAQSRLQASQASAQESAQALAELRSQTEQDRERLASLEGDYAELDKKYQKLLKPTRSSKGKTVVDVMYQKSGYRIRAPGEANYRSLGLAALNAELQGLKDRHGNDLYVKIIIPENSGLSYNQAWAFTRDTLDQFDYYYQDDESVAAEQ
ncbi:MAG: hypothetical protein R3E89_03705 [Thiolinea sp.]